MSSIDKIRKDGVDYDIGSNKYSLDEQIIGTWVDGKPLYRKVVTFTKAELLNLTPDVNDRRILPHNIANIERVITARLCTTTLSGDTLTNILGYLNEGTRWAVAIFDINKNGVQLNIGNDYLDMLNDGCVILEYTKTTDNGGEV